MTLPFTATGSSQPQKRSTLGSKSNNAISDSLSSLIRNASPQNTAILEKHSLSTARLSGNKTRHFFRNHFESVEIPLPGTRGKVLAIPILRVLVSSKKSPREDLSGRHLNGADDTRKDSRRRRPSVVGYLALLLCLILFGKKLNKHSSRINITLLQPSTSILTPKLTTEVWKWEIKAGHYPSRRRLPVSINLPQFSNPAVDSQSASIPLNYNASLQQQPHSGPARFPSEFLDVGALQPSGPKRKYYSIAIPHGQLNESSNLDTDKTRQASSLRSFEYGEVPNGSFPPRPPADSILDLDSVMDYCDFTTNRYVRDCLEILRTGAGLDTQGRLRRGRRNTWKHVYREEQPSHTDDLTQSAHNQSLLARDVMETLGYRQKSPLDLTPGTAKAFQAAFSSFTDEASTSSHYAVRRRVGSGLSALPHPTHPSADPMCDPDHPRIFHIFWAGAFTDKPYLAAMSFLYTQNLGLHMKPRSRQMVNFLEKQCRPQLWLWINPGPAASLPNPKARSQMFDQLRSNPWSAPFLHERFAEVVKFRLWNTTEQLDNVPEMRPYWRSLPLFNSGGVKFGTGSTTNLHIDDEEKDIASSIIGKNSDTDHAFNVTADGSMEENRGRFGNDAVLRVGQDLSDALAVNGRDLKATAGVEPEQTDRSLRAKPTTADMLNRVGSTSSKGYDRLTVVLSDMARLVLTHRFGGIYLDADTILLRDWEELWGWKGAFAYRWSRLEKYNTAVLKLHRNSAIGSFLFKSALANGLDFHPMTISKYTKDASLEGLLLRLPDALFDSAWLNTEYYQRDRPPFPYFKRFEDVRKPCLFAILLALLADSRKPVL